MVPSTEVDVSRSNVDVIRYSKFGLTHVVALDDRFGFGNRRSVGDGQHYRTVVAVQPLDIFR